MHSFSKKEDNVLGVSPPTTSHTLSDASYDINFLDKDARFSKLSGVCGSVAKQLRKDGVGASLKQASIITPEEF